MSKTIAPREQTIHRRPLFGRLTQFLNPFILTHAGSHHSTFAVLHHRGRRSGRTYATPTSARPITDGFVIPLTFGNGADWFQLLLFPEVILNSAFQTLLMPKAEYPYILPRSETEGEADFLHASSEDVLVALLS
jgi:hypothetical protein